MIEALGQYRILESAGTSDIGDVYRARDTRLGRTVAVTVVRAEIAADPSKRDRFLGDARAAMALSHPNIAIVYEVGTDGEHMYLASEFVSGRTIRSLTGAGPMNPRRAVDLAVQLTDALAEAHAEGISHRNLRSDRVMVTPKGSAKIVDFGLADWSGSPQSWPAARAEETGAEAGQRADIRALGRILLEMLAGSGRGSPVTPEGAPGPEELRRILARALGADGGPQYEAAATLSAELRSIGAVLDVRSGEGEPPSRTGKKPPQPGTRWAVVAAVLAGLIALIWAALRAT